MKTFEEQKAFVSKLNVIDDIFFQKMADDKEVCEEMLQIILKNPKLKVVESQTQRYLRNMGTHSVILDLLCQDEKGNYFNVEVQKADDDNHQKRVRFNHSNIDTIFVERGIKYKDLPDVYIIFISKFAPFGEEKTIYHINRVIQETGTVVDNGVHEIYVNTAIVDDSDISELMQYFKKSTGENPKFKKLSNRVHYFKETQEGVQIMCELVENYAKDYAKEYVKECDREKIINLLKNGVSSDIILKSFPAFTLDEIESLIQQVNNPPLEEVGACKKPC
jgi:predicted transposase/invertase (TIGR01784 family)